MFGENILDRILMMASLEHLDWFPPTRNSSLIVVWMLFFFS